MEEEEKQPLSWVPKFLEVLKQTKNAKEACRQAGIYYNTAHVTRRRKPEFKKAWSEAMAEGINISDKGDLGDIYARMVSYRNRLREFDE